MRSFISKFSWWIHESAFSFNFRQTSNWLEETQLLPSFNKHSKPPKRTQTVFYQVYSCDISWIYVPASSLYLYSKITNQQNCRSAVIFLIWLFSSTTLGWGAACFVLYWGAAVGSNGMSVGILSVHTSQQVVKSRSSREILYGLDSCLCCFLLCDLGKFLRNLFFFSIYKMAVMIVLAS